MFWLPQDLKRELDRVTLLQGIARSPWIRKVIEHKLKAMQAKGKVKA